MSAALPPRSGWLAELVSGAGRVVAFARSANAANPAAAPKRRTSGVRKKTGTPRKRIDLVRALAARGVEHHEIARSTGLSQDTVVLLLNLASAPAAPAESAANGTFFRALQARLA